MPAASDFLRSTASRKRQSAFAAIACVVAIAPAFILSMPVAAIAIGLLPLAVVFALGFPFVVCLGFVIFSFFRIHEVFPVLIPLHIPQALAIGALAVLGWHVVLKKSIQVFWPRELTAFAVLFVLVTIGMFFASNKPVAFAYWTDTYVKIGTMTVAIVWLTRRPIDFAVAAHAIVLAGVLVACVTLYNKVEGIGLVEGTRVTIGRDIQSVLGDPNDLSLVLLFPLSFAGAIAVQRIGVLSALLGIVGASLIAAAIIATQSRGGLLGIVVVSGIIGARLVNSKITLFVIGGLAALVLFAAAGISDRSSGGAGESGIDESSMGRIYAWGAAIHMATARPLTGVGINNFVSNYYAYSEHWDGHNHAVHSTWFGVLAETGFPGLISFIVMIVMMVSTSIKSNRILAAAHSAASTRAAALATLAGIAGFCMSGTFLTQGFTWPIYILLAMTAAVGRFAQNEAKDRKPLTPAAPADGAGLPQGAAGTRLAEHFSV
jgi:putative inorganic carbon (HCO3(-)) transporter